jgi:FAD/FMN-containing dehydrogenase
VIFGHIGDAHVHVNIFSDPADPAHASDLLRDFARQAVALGGTVSAEHGLGKCKRHLLDLQYSAAEIGCGPPDSEAHRQVSEFWA